MRNTLLRDLLEESLQGHISESKGSQHRHGIKCEEDRKLIWHFTLRRTNAGCKDK